MSIDMGLLNKRGAAGDTRGHLRAWYPHALVSALLSRVSGAALIAVFVLLIGLPLATVLLQSIMPGLFDPVSPTLAVDITAFSNVMSTARVMNSILHSLELGASVSVLATLLGGAFAVVVQRFVFPLRAFLSLVPWLVFLTPSYLKALAWVLLMSPGGYLAQLELLPGGLDRLFFGLPGLVFVHTLNLFPMATFITGGALAGLGSEYEDAARLSGASPVRAWLAVNIPLLAPAIALSCIVIFAEVLSDLGMASTIALQSNFGVLTYGIYAAASDYPVDFPMAGAQALTLLLLILVAVVVERVLRRGADARLISGRSRPVRTYNPAWWRWLLTAAMFVAAFLALYLPLATIAARALTKTLGAGLALSNFTLSHIATAMSLGTAANTALLRSLAYAGATAMISCVIALLLCAQLDRAGRIARMAVLSVALGAIAIPGIVLGFGYILVWNRLPGFSSWPFPRYGDGSLLITGYVSAALPYCLVVILSAVGQLAPSLNDAARLHGVPPTTRLLRITLPLVMVSVLTAFLLTFIRTVFELPISQLLIPVSGTPVPPLVVRLFNHDNDGQAAALSLMSMLMSGGIAGLIWLIARRYLMPAWQKAGAENHYRQAEARQ